MTRRELKLALQCFCFQLEEKQHPENQLFRMDKPRSAAIHYGKGARADPACIEEVFRFLQPLVEQMEKEEKL